MITIISDNLDKKITVCREIINSLEQHSHAIAILPWSLDEDKEANTDWESRGFIMTCLETDEEDPFMRDRFIKFLREMEAYYVSIQKK